MKNEKQIKKKVYLKSKSKGKIQQYSKQIKITWKSKERPLRSNQGKDKRRKESNIID